MKLKLHFKRKKKKFHSRDPQKNFLRQSKEWKIINSILQFFPICNFFFVSQWLTTPAVNYINFLILSKIAILPTLPVIMCYNWLGCPLYTSSHHKFKFSPTLLVFLESDELIISFLLQFIEKAGLFLIR